MRVLHLLGWRLCDIKNNLATISEQGFDAIQISPVQPSKDESSYVWWMSYQPTGFSIGNRYGSKEELKELCCSASYYGIDVIVDVVCNHMAGNNDGSLSPHEMVDANLKNRPDFWKEARQVKNWDDRYEVTHYCMGLPGLNSSNHDLQDMIVNFLNELIDCGVLGFRFDAAKSIGLPEEGCDFWPRVIYLLKKYGLTLYGEVIFADNKLIESYSRFIKVLTNSPFSDHDKIFSFVESHDSYYDFGYTKDKDSEIIAREYLNLVREYDNTLFFARPFDDTWKSEIVRRANLQNKHYYRKVN